MRIFQILGLSYQRTFDFPVHIANAFTSEFMELLLKRLGVDADPGIRLIVQKILHTLLDRHGNADQLRHVRVYRPKALHKYLQWEKVARRDMIFMKKASHFGIGNTCILLCIWCMYYSAYNADA